MGATQSEPRPTAAFDELRRLKEWRIVVPYFIRDYRGMPTSEVGFTHFPPRDVTSYTFTETIDLLKVFCQRWTHAHIDPSPDLEPHAIEVNNKPRRRDGSYRPLAGFTLREYNGPAFRLSSSEDFDIEEDEAGQWLQEGERHLDL